MFSICRERASAHRYTIHDISVLQSQFPKIALSLPYQDSVELRQMLLSGELDGAFLLPGHTEGIAGFERWDLPYRIYALISPENPLGQRSTFSLRDFSVSSRCSPARTNRHFPPLCISSARWICRWSCICPRRGRTPWTTAA